MQVKVVSLYPRKVGFLSLKHVFPISVFVLFFVLPSAMTSATSHKKKTYLHISETLAVIWSIFRQRWYKGFLNRGKFPGIISTTSNCAVLLVSDKVNPKYASMASQEMSQVINHKTEFSPHLKDSAVLTLIVIFFNYSTLKCYWSIVWFSPPHTKWSCKFHHDVMYNSSKCEMCFED